MRSFLAITPCGGTIEEVQLTVQSVAAVAEAHPNVTFEHHLVFNNGLSPEPSCGIMAPNYQQVVTNLAGVASRAQARNRALDLIRESPGPGVVCFMDSGDRLVDRGSIDRVFADIDRLPANSLWAFSARIVGANVSSTRKPRPLWTRKIGNPFFIGATFVTKQLADAARFSEGAKEDWKYWLDLLSHEPHIEIGDEIAYEYQVVSATDHLRRKGQLLGDQYDFFAQHLGYGHGVRTSVSMIAHIALAGGSWVRRIRPPRRDSR